jgi:hypothetical protein
MATAQITETAKNLRTTRIQPMPIISRVNAVANVSNIFKQNACLNNDVDLAFRYHGGRKVRDDRVIRYQTSIPQVAEHWTLKVLESEYLKRLPRDIASVDFIDGTRQEIPKQTKLKSVSTYFDPL